MTQEETARAAQTRERLENTAFVARHTTVDKPRDKAVTCSHCRKPGHEKDTCYQLHGYPEGWGRHSIGGRGRGRGRGISVSTGRGAGGQQPHTAHVAAVGSAGSSGGSDPSSSGAVVPSLTAEQWDTFKALLASVKDAPTEKLSGDFLTGKSSPSSTDDSEWFQLDALIQGWILSTVNDEICDLVLSTTNSASELLKAIYNIFHDNKPARAMQLEHQFRTTMKGSLSIAAYCQTLRNLADWLDDVDAPVSEQQLVLQVLRGLPDDLQGQTSFLQYQTPPPTFLQTRSALLLIEQQRAELGVGSNMGDGGTALYAGTGEIGGEAERRLARRRRREQVTAVGDAGVTASHFSGFSHAAGVTPRLL
ncbi:unnamed protein product [Cuscuta campestris]|uniref:Retrotransposon gag domain-containing protein n=1 Tax=Cuscuta campestris TaxID=132261 RepID=A0A484LUJ0_9ASTE|nr:unnamed protein product [Cuscuta campestris]